MIDETTQALDEIVAVSRKLGQDPALVLHGGGNTSIKGVARDVTGQSVEVVWVKGSGWDLGSIEPAGFAPLRRERLLQVLQCESLSDPQMVNELRQASLDAIAPTASIEALLHAFIPARVVLHSHADAIVTLTNQPDGAQLAAQTLGHGVHVLPYVMPGFDLARLVAGAAETILGGGIDAIVLANHGLFTFADDAETAYARHLELVGLASAAAGVTEWGAPGEPREPAGDVREIAAFRRALSRAAGRPMIVQQSDSARAAAFAKRPDAGPATSRGTATPEHIIRTKRTPLIGRDVDAYAADYRRYVAENSAGHDAVVELDPAPRVILDAEWGLLTAGASVKDAGIARDIALHTLDIIEAADRLSSYASLDEQQSFDMEYWELEQAKLRGGPRPTDFAGRVALVTGAASGIGRASAEALLAAGAAVVGIDSDEAVTAVSGSAAWRGILGEVSDAAVLRRALETAVRTFGGLDVLVIAGGAAPASQGLAKLGDEHWERGIAANATAVARLLRESHPLLAQAPFGASVVLVTTKDVAAPGPGSAAYSASMAAAAQLARVAALEWAADGIRVNQVEPGAVFDTGSWTPELLAARAARYGLSVEEYTALNLLGLEVTSRRVADAVLALSSSTFGATTGAHVSVDGGNDRVI